MGVNVDLDGPMPGLFLHTALDAAGCFDKRPGDLEATRAPSLRVEQLCTPDGWRVALVAGDVPLAELDPERAVLLAGQIAEAALAVAQRGG